MTSLSTEVVVLDFGSCTRYRIQPRDIEVRVGGGAGFFGKSEIEQAAGLLLRFFQKIGTWRPFSLFEYSEFLKDNAKTLEHGLFGLMGPWFDDAMMVGGVKEPKYIYMVNTGLGNIAVTEKLIERLSAIPR